MRLPSAPPSPDLQASKVILKITQFFTIRRISQPPKTAMEKPPSLASHNGAQASKTGDPSTTFDTMRDLLKARDDTSRFVGLALLKSVLDNEALVNDSERLHVLWEAISPKFLDRLLRAEQGGKTSKEEARNMIDLAVSILHTFTVLLPEASRKEKRLTGRTAPLIRALLQRSVWMKYFARPN